MQGHWNIRSNCWYYCCGTIEYVYIEAGADVVLLLFLFSALYYLVVNRSLVELLLVEIHQVAAWCRGHRLAAHLLLSSPSATSSSCGSSLTLAVFACAVFFFFLQPPGWIVFGLCCNMFFLWWRLYQNLNKNVIYCRVLWQTLSNNQTYNISKFFFSSRLVLN